MELVCYNGKVDANKCGRAVWACIRQKTPMAVGTGASRGREGNTDRKARYVWRNMIFRNLGAGLSSDLIKSATEITYREWERRYGNLPEERLRTEIAVGKVKSTNPGYCYRMAGWERGPQKRGKLFLYAPLQAVRRDADDSGLLVRSLLVAEPA